MGIVVYFIAASEKLAIHAEGLFDLFFKEIFNSALKEEIQAQVIMQCPTTWLEASERDKEVEMVINS
jgi:hypothetical protein